MIFNNDIPYVVYTDGSTGKGMVEDYVSNAWATVGSADFTPGGASYIDPVFYNNNLYVAYSDGTKTNFVTVEEYTGGSWSMIGTEGFGGQA